MNKPAAEKQSTKEKTAKEIPVSKPVAKKKGSFWVGFVFFVAIIAVVVSGYNAYYAYEQNNIFQTHLSQQAMQFEGALKQLNNTQSQLQTQLNAQTGKLQADLMQLQQKMTEIQAEYQKPSTEVSQQLSRVRIESALLSLQFAKQQLAFSGNQKAAKAWALDAKENLMLANATGSALTTVNQAILRLDHDQQKSLKQVVAGLQKLQDQASKLTPKLPGETSEKPKQREKALAGWRAHLTGALEKLQALVSIRNKSELDFVLQTAATRDQLRQNVNLLLAQAQFAAMRLDEPGYVENLNQVKTWVSAYFAASKAKTAWLEQLQSFIDTPVRGQASLFDISIQTVEKLSTKGLSDGGAE